MTLSNAAMTRRVINKFGWTYSGRTSENGKTLLLEMSIVGLDVRVVVFYITFNNIWAMSWRSVLLVEKTRVPEEN
jgi:hypothetical protein